MIRPVLWLELENVCAAIYLKQSILPTNICMLCDRPAVVMSRTPETGEKSYE